MPNATSLTRFDAIEYLGVDEAQFESLLGKTGIPDSEVFEEDQLKVLASAKGSSFSVSRSRGAIPMGESQPATSFESVLDTQAQLMRQQAEAALERYNLQVGETFQYVLDEARGIQNHWAGEFSRSLHGAIDTQAVPMDDRQSLPGD